MLRRKVECDKIEILIQRSEKLNLKDMDSRVGFSRRIMSKFANTYWADESFERKRGIRKSVKNHRLRRSVSKVVVFAFAEFRRDRLEAIVKN